MHHNLFLLKQLCTRVARVAGLLLLLFAGGGCNGDVFIDDFMPGNPPSVSIGQEGATVTVSFEEDNWGIHSLGSFYGSFGVQATDLEGNDLYLPLDEGQTGIVRIIDDFLDLEAVKRNGREVELTLRENLFDNPVELNLVVGNSYEEKTIPVRVASGTKYRLLAPNIAWTAWRMTGANSSPTTTGRSGCTVLLWTIRRAPTPPGLTSALMRRLSGTSISPCWAR